MTQDIQRRHAAATDDGAIEKIKEMIVDEIRRDLLPAMNPERVAARILEKVRTLLSDRAAREARARAMTAVCEAAKAVFIGAYEDADVEIVTLESFEALKDAVYALSAHAPEAEGK